MTRTLALSSLAVVLTSAVLNAQAFPPSPDFVPGNQGSRNVHIVSHLPMGRGFSTSDIEVEQELARPYAYVSRMLHPTGFDIVSLKDPAKPSVLFAWRIENGELHQGT